MAMNWIVLRDSQSDRPGIGPECAGSRPRALSSLFYSEVLLRHHSTAVSAAPPLLKQHLGSASQELEQVSKPQFFPVVTGGMPQLAFLGAIIWVK